MTNIFPRAQRSTKRMKIEKLVVDDEHSSNISRRENFLPLVFLLSFSALGWLAWAFFGADFLFKLLARFNSDAAKEIDSLAKFGDAFGAINALFTALAFGGLIWSGIMQRKELSMQRAQLFEQGQAIKAQTAAIMKTNEIMFEQGFTSEFLFCINKLIEFQNTLTSSSNNELLKYYNDFHALYELGKPKEATSYWNLSISTRKQIDAVSYVFETIIGFIQTPNLSEISLLRMHAYIKLSVTREFILVYLLECYCQRNINRYNSISFLDLKDLLKMDLESYLKQPND